MKRQLFENNPQTYYEEVTQKFLKVRNDPINYKAYFYIVKKRNSTRLGFPKET